MVKNHWKTCDFFLELLGTFQGSLITSLTHPDLLGLVFDISGMGEGPPMGRLNTCEDCHHRSFPKIMSKTESRQLIQL